MGSDLLTRPSTVAPPPPDQKSSDKDEYRGAGCKHCDNSDNCVGFPGHDREASLICRNWSTDKFQICVELSAAYNCFPIAVADRDANG